MSIPVAILCGGRGTRLGALTADRPKCLVEVAGRPFLAWQMEWLAAQGFSDIVLFCGWMGPEISKYFSGNVWSGTIQYAFDGEKPLGTGGCLCAQRLLLGPEFFVLNGDTLPEVKLTEMRQALRGEVKAVIGRTGEGVNAIDAGIYLLRISALRHRTGAFQLDEALRSWQLSGKRRIFPVASFIDMGTPEGLARMETKLRPNDWC